jgi:hypothetical protein
VHSVRFVREADAVTFKASISPMNVGSDRYDRVRAFERTREQLLSVAMVCQQPQLIEYLRGEWSPQCLMFGRQRIHDQTPERLFMGFCSAECQPGDAIVLVKGARAPCIMRPVGNGQFRNLGQAYIRYIMKGELADCLHEEDWEDIKVV